MAKEFDIDSIINPSIQYSFSNSLLEEENKKLSPLRDKKMESVAKLQKLNLDMTSLEEEETRVKSLQIKLEKSVRTIESDSERERSISLDAELNEKRISKEKEELLKTENELIEVESVSSKELNASKTNLNNLQLHIWTVNKINHLKECIEIGCDGVITDEPVKFRDYLNSKYTFHYCLTNKLGELLIIKVR